MERTAFAILLVLAAGWILVLVVGLVSAWPFGLIGLLALAAVGLLFIRVLRDRLRSDEDDYYSDTVDK